MRLACVKHSASVRSEPGSNSQVHTPASLPAYYPKPHLNPIQQHPPTIPIPTKPPANTQPTNNTHHNASQHHSSAAHASHPPSSITTTTNRPPQQTTENKKSHMPKPAIPSKTRTTRKHQNALPNNRLGFKRTRPLLECLVAEPTSKPLRVGKPHLVRAAVLSGRNHRSQGPLFSGPASGEGAVVGRRLLGASPAGVKHLFQKLLPLLHSSRSRIRQAIDLK